MFQSSYSSANLRSAHVRQFMGRDIPRPCPRPRPTITADLRLLAGQFLDAVDEGYNVYLVTDASPTLNVGEPHLAISRLVQAVVVPTAIRQIISEVTQRDRLPTLI